MEDAMPEPAGEPSKRALVIMGIVAFVLLLAAFAVVRLNSR
jgi:hypothetical protein